MAKLTIDDDDESFWVTSTYLSQFGNRPEDFKPGVGIRVTLVEPATIRELKVAATPGAHIEVRGLRDANSTNLDDTTVLGSATATSGTTTIEIDSRDTEWKNLVVWISGLPTAAEAVADNNSDSGADTNADAESQNSDADNPLVGDRNLAEQSPDSLLPVAIGDIQVRGTE